MSDAGQGLAKVAAELVGPLKNTLEKLTGPWATEIGLSFGDSARKYRFEHAVKLFKKVERMAADAGLELKPVAPRLLFPILESATIEDDEDMHTRWAALLTNASVAECSAQILPGFPEILKQLTPAEARFLDTAYDEIADDGYGPKVPIKDATIASATSIMIGDLERLGVVDRHLGEDKFEGLGRNVFGATNHLLVSAFGRVFIRACRAPKRT
jgi:hypothetical protein